MVWDIGACSGSVAIEAGRITGTTVFAVEKDRKRIKDIRENKKRFGADLKIIEGTAPAALKGLPRPDAVFAGGGGKGIKEILAAVEKALKPGGRVVVNAITMETASAAFEFFRNGWTRELVLASVSKARQAGDLNMLSAHNPVFIIKGKR